MEEGKKKGWNGWRSKGVDELRAGWEAAIERVRKDERRGKQMEPEGGCSDFIYSLVLPPRPLWQAEKNLADWSKSHTLHTRHWQMACEVHSPQLFLFMRSFRRWEYYLSSGTAWCVLTLTPSVYLWLMTYTVFMMLIPIPLSRCLSIDLLLLYRQLNQTPEEAQNM